MFLRHPNFQEIETAWRGVDLLAKLSSFGKLLW